MNEPNESESSWQPVRIAPHDRRDHWEMSKSTAQWRARMSQEPVENCFGKIIRVRPAPQDVQLCVPLLCGGQLFHVHPDDAFTIIKTRERSNFVLCEHQIQAD